jgi:hypothetical protein
MPFNCMERSERTSEHPADSRHRSRPRRSLSASRRPARRSAAAAAAADQAKANPRDRPDGQILLLAVQDGSPSAGAGHQAEDGIREEDHGADGQPGRRLAEEDRDARPALLRLPLARLAAEGADGEVQDREHGKEERGAEPARDELDERRRVDRGGRPEAEDRESQ